MLCITLFINLILVTSSVFSKCPDRTHEENPKFIKRMKISVIATFGELETLECCVDGFSEIKWSFRTNDKMQWKTINGEDTNTLLQGLNTTFTMLQALTRYQGYYRCEAWDMLGNKIEGQTRLKISCSDISGKLYLTTSTIKTDYTVGEPIDLDCNLEGNQNVNMMWAWWFYPWNSTSFNIPDSKGHKIPIGTAPNTTTGYIYTNYTYQEKGTCGKDFLILKTVLHINQSDDSSVGSYTCKFNTPAYIYYYTFNITVHSNRNVQAITYGALGIVCSTFFFFVICLGLWCFYYDILFHFVASSHVPSFQVTLVYAEHQLDLALLIARDLEARKCPTFLFHRDQKYGIDRLNLIQQQLNKSTLCVFLCSSDCFQEQSPDFQLFDSCLKYDFQQSNPQLRSIYILYHPLSKFKQSTAIDFKRIIKKELVCGYSPRVWRWKFIYSYYRCSRRRMVLWILLNCFPQGPRRLS